MDPRRENELLLTRRQLFGRATLGVGTAALASLVHADTPKAHGGQPGFPNFAPKAKRVINSSA